jgi:hypothetical protein
MAHHDSLGGIPDNVPYVSGGEHPQHQSAYAHPQQRGGEGKVDADQLFGMLASAGMLPGNMPPPRHY